MSTESFRIIIIGGGIAGLATAHILERAKREGRAPQNLQVEVYEKGSDPADANHSSTFSKYPIWIAPEGRSALQNILTPSEFDDLLTVSDHGLTHGGISILTPDLARLFSVRRYEGETPFAVHRRLLNEVLAAKGDINITYGRSVVRVSEKGPKLGVEVEFHDATVKTADLVICANGAGSVIRGQMYPSLTRFPTLSYLTIQFKLLPPSTPLKLYDPHGINTITSSGSTAYSLLLIPLSGHEVPPLPASAMENNPFSDPSEATPTLASLDEPNPEYTFCAFSMPTFPEWQDMTPHSWIDKVAGLLEDDAADRGLVEAIRSNVVPQTVGAWQVVCCDEKKPLEWKGGRAVFIGDAAHTMPPQGGAGGACALRDAEALSETLLSSSQLGGSAGSDLDDLLPKFHAGMLVRGYGYMRDARRRMRLSLKSGWAVYWQRTLLRVMDYVWPFAHWVLSRGQVAARKATAKTVDDKKRV